METTLQRIIRNLELNENAVSTILGGVVLVIVGFLFIGYFRQTDSEITQRSQGETLETSAITTFDEDTGLVGETSSAAVERYVVAKGETLWSIAEDHYGDGYKWSEIAQVNGLENPDQLNAETILDLPRIEDISDSSNEILEVEQTTPDSEKDSLSTYIVQSNDSLWKIAQSKYNDGFMWNRIWQANQDKLSSPNLLENGMTLTIP